MRPGLYALLIGTLLFAGLSGGSGCTFVAGATTLLAPPELVDAKYALPDKRTLILVDDRRPTPVVNNAAMLRRVNGAIRAALVAEEVNTVGFVSEDEINALRNELGDAFSELSLAALASRLDAKQVIHAEVIGYQMDMGGGVVRPGIAFGVKVFDMDELKRTFPTDSPSGTYQVATQTKARDLTGQSAERTVAVRELADQAGRDIGRLFFDWRRQERGSDIDER